MAHTELSQKNIIILGGSYGGVSTAHYLLKHVIPQLPDKDSYQVVLVSKSSEAVCRPACPRALVADKAFEERMFADITQAFKQYPKERFRFIFGTVDDLYHNKLIVATHSVQGSAEMLRLSTVNDLDHNKRKVKIFPIQASTEKMYLQFHALVIATGATSPSPLHGLIRDAEFLRSSWRKIRKQLPCSWDIIILGGGPAGIETAGELGEHLNGRKSHRSGYLQWKITVITDGPQILPALRPKSAQKAEEYLAAVGVTIIKNRRVTQVLPKGVGTWYTQTSDAKLIFENGETMSADLFIPATGTLPNNRCLPDSWLAADGRVDTNPSTLRVDKAGGRVYAVGDVSNAAPPAIHHILDAVPVLCTNLKRDLLRIPSEEDAACQDKTIYKDRIFKPQLRETHLVRIGKSKGVGIVRGWALPSCVVWALKGRNYWLGVSQDVWSGKYWAKER
ncbi:MAG: hypothetical protein Q9169_004658 [Polycauliona sp. 2 TL-2023]